MIAEFFPDAENIVKMEDFLGKKYIFVADETCMHDCNTERRKNKQIMRGNSRITQRKYIYIYI